MADELRRPGMTYLTELKPGETWIYDEQSGAIVICHPDRPPRVVGDPAIRRQIDTIGKMLGPDLDGIELEYTFVDETEPRLIKVLRHED